MMLFGVTAGHQHQLQAWLAAAVLALVGCGARTDLAWHDASLVEASGGAADRSRSGGASSPNTPITANLGGTTSGSSTRFDAPGGLGALQPAAGGYSAASGGVAGSSPGGAAMGGTITSTSSSQSARVTAVDVAVGAEQGCALYSNGTVACWLWQSDPTPTVVPGLVDIAALSVGGRGLYNALDACAVAKSGLVRCWNSSAWRQDLEGAIASRPTLITAAGLAFNVSVGGDHVCVLLRDFSLQCWGSNMSGQLGIEPRGVAFAPETPVRVRGLADVVQVAAGGEHTCAVLKDGTLRCWGYLSLEGHYDYFTSPQDVGLRDVVGVAAGVQRICQLFRDGSTSCWLDITYGSGYGPYYSPARPSPAFLAPAEVPTAMLAVGDHHDCALKSDHSVTCWGSASEGQLGLGSYEEPPGIYRDNPGPGTVIGIDDASAISVNGAHSCAVRSNGSVWCWGADLGAVTEHESAVPVELREGGERRGTP